MIQSMTLLSKEMLEESSFNNSGSYYKNNYSMSLVKKYLDGLTAEAGNLPVKVRKCYKGYQSFWWLRAPIGEEKDEVAKRLFDIDEVESVDHVTEGLEVTVR